MDRFATVTAAAGFLLFSATSSNAAAVYTYTYDGPTAPGGTIHEVAQFSLSAPLAANSSVKWDLTPNSFPGTWLGGTIKLVGAGAPANYSVTVTNFATDTDASGKMKDWYIWGQAFLPNNTYLQAYSINSLAANQPLGVNVKIAYDQAVVLAGQPYAGQFSFLINPSGSTVANWTEQTTNGNVAATPLPAALPMFGAALVGLGGLARRRAKKAA